MNKIKKHDPSATAKQAPKTIKPAVKTQNKAPSGKAKAPVARENKAAKEADKGKVELSAQDQQALNIGAQLRIKLSSEELHEKVKKLIKLAREQGYLTYADINESLPSDLIDPDELEGFILLLRGMDIEIIDASDVEQYKKQA